MTSLYAKYIQERGGKEIIESDKGFATYYFTQEHVYIEDVYVLPEFRQENIASSMTDEIINIAKEKGYKKLLGSVCPKALNSTHSLKVLLNYGFKPLSCDGNLMYLEKEI